MCYTTKDHIVLALRQLMQDKSLQKIKVQDVMTLTGMTRQSFYYHFQDIYQVVEWEVERKLLKPCAYHKEQNCQAWLEQTLLTIEQDHNFYRRVVKYTDFDSLYRDTLPFVQPAINAFLFDDPNPPADTITEQGSQIVDFFSYSLSYLIIAFAESRDTLEDSKERTKFETLKMVMRATKKELKLQGKA